MKKYRYFISISHDGSYKLDTSPKRYDVRTGSVHYFSSTHNIWIISIFTEKDMLAGKDFSEINKEELALLV